MLGQYPIAATIPVTDLKRAIDFYVNKLGLKKIDEEKAGVTLEAGEGTKLYLYQRGPSKADHTLAAFSVTNLESVVKELTAQGIVFEKYDFPGLKTDEAGIARMEGEGEKGAWFKDPDGNIIGIGERIS